MKKYIYLLLIASSVIVSCSSPKALEYRDYHNFAIRSLGFNSSEVSLVLEYYNPNNFGMKLKNTDLDIYIDSILLGHSSTDTTILIPRKDNFLMPVRFKVDMKNVFKNAWNTLIGKEVTVRLTGKVKVGKGNVFINFPIEYTSKQTFSLWDE